MTEKRVSMFVSHKVVSHQRAAGRIKAILESRTERLDVYTGELMRALDLNCRAMELLANRFLELVREDCGRARVMMQRNRSKEAKLQ
jgi:hypothetical protein